MIMANIWSDYKEQAGAWLLQAISVVWKAAWVGPSQVSLVGPSGCNSFMWDRDGWDRDGRVGLDG